jgi:hypothetical protein
VRHRVAHTGRLALLSALVMLGFAALAYAGGVARTGSAGPASADQYQPRKITICHHARGKKGTVRHVTIRISQSAWRAHQRHGDTLGPCATARNKRVHKGKAHAAKFHKPAKAKSQGKGKGKGKK